MGMITWNFKTKKYANFFQQNTYQLVLATDEIRSFVVFNYGNVNWTSSSAAGGFSGRGGRQSAVVSKLHK